MIFKRHSSSDCSFCSLRHINRKWVTLNDFYVIPNRLKNSFHVDFGSLAPISFLSFFWRAAFKYIWVSFVYSQIECFCCICVVIDSFSSFEQIFSVINFSTFTLSCILWVKTLKKSNLSDFYWNWNWLSKFWNISMSLKKKPGCNENRLSRGISSHNKETNVTCIAVITVIIVALISLWMTWK